MKKMILILGTLLLLVVSSCTPDSGKLKNPDTKLLSYVSQADSLVKDTVIISDCEQYHYVVFSKDNIKQYYVDSNTRVLLFILLSLMLGAIIGFLIGQ